MRDSQAIGIRLAAGAIVHALHLCLPSFARDLSGSALGTPPVMRGIGIGWSSTVTSSLRSYSVPPLVGAVVPDHDYPSGKFPVRPDYPGRRRYSLPGGFPPVGASPGLVGAGTR